MGRRAGGRGLTLAASSEQREYQVQAGSEANLERKRGRLEAGAAGGPRASDGGSG